MKIHLGFFLRWSFPGAAPQSTQQSGTGSPLRSRPLIEGIVVRRAPMIRWQGRMSN